MATRSSKTTWPRPTRSFATARRCASGSARFEMRLRRWPYRAARNASGIRALIRPSASRSRTRREPAADRRQARQPDKGSRVAASSVGTRAWAPPGLAATTGLAATDPTAAMADADSVPDAPKPERRSRQRRQPPLRGPATDRRGRRTGRSQSVRSDARQLCGRRADAGRNAARKRSGQSPSARRQGRRRGSAGDHRKQGKARSGSKVR